MASGAVEDCHKFYFYAEEENIGLLFMAEATISTPSRRLTVVVKCGTKKGDAKVVDVAPMMKSFESVLKGEVRTAD